MSEGEQMSAVPRVPLVQPNLSSGRHVWLSPSISASHSYQCKSARVRYCRTSSQKTKRSDALLCLFTHSFYPFSEPLLPTLLFLLLQFKQCQQTFKHKTFSKTSNFQRPFYSNICNNDWQRKALTLQHTLFMCRLEFNEEPRGYTISISVVSTAYHYRSSKTVSEPWNTIIGI